MYIDIKQNVYMDYIQYSIWLKDINVSVIQV